MPQVCPMILHEREFARLLSSPLGGELLKVEVNADVYAADGFRFLASPAHLERAQMEGKSQRLRNILKVSPERARSGYVRLGYESHLDLDEVEVYLSRLLNPRDRLIWELFWPHLSPRHFAPIEEEKRIFSPALASQLSSVTLSGRDEERVLATHALAIAHHNQAISEELAFAAGRGSGGEEHWQRALAFWAAVLDSEAFWSYLRRRAEGYDDPRCRADDVDRLRDDLPAVLLGFNALFAQAYAKADHPEGTARHVALIRGCPLPEAARDAVLRSLVKKAAEVSLEPLRHRVQKDLKDHSEKKTYQSFDKVCKPMLDEADSIRSYLLGACGFPEEMVDSSDFDRLCDAVLEALNSGIDYKSDDRVRTILYSSLVAKRLLSLPLSPRQRRRIEQSIANDRRLLYQDFLDGNQEIDHTRCGFMAGEEADPASSFVFPVHKVTDTSGGTIRWQTTSILVPRSRLAAAIHDGKVDLEALAGSPGEDLAPSSGGVLGESLRDRIRSLGARLRHDLVGFDETARREREELELRVEKAEAKLGAKVAAEKKRHEEFRRQAKAEIDRKVAAAEREVAAVKDRVAGLRGGWRIELPVVAAAFPLIAAMAWVLLPGFSVGDLWWCGAGSLLAGGLGGRLIRGHRIAVAAAVVTRLIDEKAAELTKADRERRERVEELEAATAKALGPTRAKLEKIARRRGEILSRHGPKPASEKDRFAPLKNSEKQGYKGGAKPSESEIQAINRREMEKFRHDLNRFMATLSFEERQTLANLSQTMSQEKFGNLLETLMNAPASQRRSLLLVGMLDRF